jgi:hypothetical protein
MVSPVSGSELVAPHPHPGVNVVASVRRRYRRPSHVLFFDLLRRPDDFDVRGYSVSNQDLRIGSLVSTAGIPAAWFQFPRHFGAAAVVLPVRLSFHSSFNHRLAEHSKIE